MSVILCSDKKGQVLRHNLPPPKSSPGWVSAQPAAPSGPGPQTLLRHQCWGSRAPKPPGPQAPRAPHVGAPGRSCRWHPRQTELPWGGIGERVPAASRPGPGQWSHSEESGEQQDTASLPAPGPPGHPLARGWMIWRALRRRPGSSSFLTVCLMITAPLTLAECPH